jgi:hypothetical protein
MEAEDDQKVKRNIGDTGSPMQSSSATEGSLDVGACSLCHCALDYSDRAAFFREDREVDYSSRSRGGNGDNSKDADSSDEYYFRPDDPYLPVDLYDPNNALLYCDSCDRLYHQQCHFVPVLAVPRGAWYCMVCQTSAPSPPSTKPSSPRGRKFGNMRKSDLIDCDPSLMFTSPPNVDAADAERAWELTEALTKAREVAQQVHKIQRYCQTQLGNYRLACTAIETLTSTQKNLHHFIFSNPPGGGHGGRNFGGARDRGGISSARGSQELAQTILKLASSKYKLRYAVLSVDEWRRGVHAHKSWKRLGQLIDGGCTSPATVPAPNNNHEGHPPPPPPRSSYLEDFVARVLFPFGRSLPIRTVPRTEEAVYDAAATNTKAHDSGAGTDIAAVVPAEVVFSMSHCTDGNGGSIGGHGQRQHDQQEAKQTHQMCYKSGDRKKSNDPKPAGGAGERVAYDVDDGVSVNNLTCCICWQSTATDENDLVLCDGHGCARAYHMNCVHPHLTQQDLDEDDWFCPICTCLADLLHLIQSETLGDEWEVRRRARAARHLPCDGSLKSWDGPDDVFPTSEWEYETAQKLAKNQRDPDTNALLARVLGFDEDALDAGDADRDVTDDDDDDSDDEHFDPVAYEEERQKIRSQKEDDDVDKVDDSTRSSQLTLFEMSSVELSIGWEELAALSDEDVEDGYVDGSGAPLTRRSRRLAKKFESDASSSDDDGRRDDPGKLDKSNILEGKRNRKPVDYRRLNDAMFGDLPDEKIAMMDAGDDYKERGTVASSSKKSSTSKLSSRENGTDDHGGGSGDEIDESRRSSTLMRRGFRVSDTKVPGRTWKAPQSPLNDGESKRRSIERSRTGHERVKEIAAQPRNARNGFHDMSPSNGGAGCAKRGKTGATARAPSPTKQTVKNGIKRKRVSGSRSLR